MDKNSTIWDRKGEYFFRQSINKIVDNRKMLCLLLLYLKHHTPQTILEVGCGAGSIYNILKDIYGRKIEEMYYGIDIAINNINFTHLLYPAGWFKYSDIRTMTFTHTYDIIYSSEVLPHLPLKNIKHIIKQLIDNSNDLCLFSMKTTDLEDLEYKFEIKEQIGYYTFPNFIDIKNYIEELISSDRNVVFYKEPYHKWFMRRPYEDQYRKYYKYKYKSYNLIVIITKKGEKI